MSRQSAEQHDKPAIMLTLGCYVGAFMRVILAVDTTLRQYAGSDQAHLQGSAMVRKLVWQGPRGCPGP